MATFKVKDGKRQVGQWSDRYEAMALAQRKANETGRTLVLVDGEGMQVATVTPDRK